MIPPLRCLSRRILLQLSTADFAANALAQVSVDAIRNAMLNDYRGSRRFRRPGRGGRRHGWRSKANRDEYGHDRSVAGLEALAN
jgi:hypothetical protein